MGGGEVGVRFELSLDSDQIRILLLSKHTISPAMQQSEVTSGSNRPLREVVRKILKNGVGNVRVPPSYKQRKEWTQQVIEPYVGVSWHTISSWQSGKQWPSSKSIEIFCRRLSEARARKDAKQSTELEEDEILLIEELQLCLMKENGKEEVEKRKNKLKNESMLYNEESKKVYEDKAAANEYYLSAYTFDIDSAITTELNPYLARLEINSSDPVPGEGLVLSFDADIMIPPEQLGFSFARLIVEISEPAWAAHERRGTDAIESELTRHYFVAPRGVSRKPAWEILPVAGHALSDGPISIYDPPMCRYPNPEAGTRISVALRFRLLDCSFADEVEDEVVAEADLGQAKQRVIDQLKKLELIEKGGLEMLPGGQVQLGQTSAVVIERPDSGEPNAD